MRPAATFLSFGLLAAFVAACGSTPSSRQPAPRPRPALPAPETRDAGADPVDEPPVDVEAGADAGETADAGLADAAPTEPTAAEAFADARPVLLRLCGSCHRRDGERPSRSARRHFDMSVEPFGGHHTRDLGRELRRVLGVTGRRATMPPDNPGSVQGDDLATIVRWADALDREAATAR